MASTPVINLRRGQAVRHNNDVCIITEMEHKTPPRMANTPHVPIIRQATGRVHTLGLTPKKHLDR